MNDKKRILVLNTSDTGGGAESVARVVSQALRNEGHEVLWAVGRKRSDLPWVVDLQSGREASWLGFGPSLTRFLASKEGKVKGAGALLRALDRVARPRNAAYWRQGRDPIDFPELNRLFHRFRPDVVHCHNLHGSGLGSRSHQGYFDLRLLAEWSQSVPVHVTLHDAWMVTGHCGHPMDCLRYRTGCGECPYLGNPPVYRCDGTAANWLTKKAIYDRAKLQVSAPSRWLLDMAANSILKPAAKELRCIPNGVDLQTWHPTEARAARAQLGLPAEANVLLYVSGGLKNPYKNFAAAYDIFRKVKAMSPAKRTVLVVGGVRPGEALPDDPDLIAVPRGGAETLRSLYGASDVYLHPAAAENHSLAVLEAMACGRPVVAFAVGGIPEQLDHGRTGMLIPPGDCEAAAGAVSDLLASPDRAAAMGRAARAETEARFDVAQMTAAYAGWLLNG